MRNLIPSNLSSFTHFTSLCLPIIIAYQVLVCRQRSSQTTNLASPASNENTQQSWQRMSLVELFLEARRIRREELMITRTKRVPTMVEERAWDNECAESHNIFNYEQKKFKTVEINEEVRSVALKLSQIEVLISNKMRSEAELQVKSPPPSCTIM
tara:strand:+ start:1802 stop:2266 length:465 start_codon:yes stop_codon:yes gene_type:complete